MSQGWSGGSETLNAHRNWTSLIAAAVGLSGLPLSLEAIAADPLALWKIVHEQCVVHQEGGEGPMPCASVDLSHGISVGVAILKDQNGIAQMLAIPTRRITGIEDPQMLAPDAPNVFAAAWKARALVEGRVHHLLPREAIAIAINSEWRRSQQQLHLHVDCLAKNVADALTDSARSLDGTWRP